MKHYKKDVGPQNLKYKTFQKIARKTYLAHKRSNVSLKLS